MIAFHQGVFTKDNKITKDVYKNVGQGCNLARSSERKKKTKPLHIINVIFDVILHFMNNLRLHNIIILIEF